MNITDVHGNVTQELTSFEKFDATTRTLLTTFTLLCFFFFLCFIGLLLSVFFTSPHIQENARYILFAHMLINDTIYVGLGTLILFSIIYGVLFPVPLCCLALAVAATSFRVTPYNLAVMCLERYIAICFPLRYPQFCVAGRAKSAIVIIWVLGFSPSLADFIAVTCTVKANFYFRIVSCGQSMLVISPLQNLIRSVVHIFSFNLVAFIILFTYLKVTQVARRFSSRGKSSALKAGKTVLLHVVQLMLCMVSFVSSVIETTFPTFPYLFIVNFLMFTCLPRFLSPLIYGIRDEVFHKCIRKLWV